MTTFIQQIIGIVLGILIGKTIWTGWEHFRNRFLTMSKEDKEKLRDLKAQRRKLKEEFKIFQKYYKRCIKKFKQMPLVVAQNEYRLLYELFLYHKTDLTKGDLVKLQCCGTVLTEKMELGGNITPAQLYDIICEMTEEKGDV